jgi:ABC-type glycerol-3-phosphate transport system substrate-binding protein
MKFTRALSGAFVLVLGTGLLAGCSSNASSDSSKLSILFAYSNGSDQEAMETIIANFEKANPDIDVTSQGLVVDKFSPALQTRVSAKNAPDVVQMPVGYIPTYAEMGVLADLSKLLPEKDVAQFSETRLTVDMQDGKLAGLPMADSVRAVIYNKTAFDKAGITPPGEGDTPWTWEEMVDAAREVQKEGGVRYGLQFEKPSMDGWLPFLYQAGGKLFDEDGTPSVGDAKGVDALSWTRKLYTEGLAAPGVIEGTQDPVQLFISGQVGLWLSGGSYQVPILDSQVEGFEWGATFLPTDVTGTTLIGGADAVAFKGGNEEAAADFIAFATSPKQIAIYDESIASLSPRSDVIVPSSRADVLAVFAEQQKQLDPTLNEQVFNPAYAASKDGMLRELQSVVIGQITPEEGAKNMAEILAKAQG